MSSITLTNINKHYGTNHVLKDINLAIEDGEFMTLLGPSGCGKTTLLRVVAGLENPEDGVMLMDKEEVINAKEVFYEEPGERGLNLVFQSYALWPHMTVFDNVGFGLDVEKVPKDEIEVKVMKALERMRIENFAQRYPSELSGGQQQRVAIARAIVTEPGVLLLDEPLSNLDAKLRIEMRSELKRLHEELNTTIIYVTHDQTEALTMSTRIAVFFEGVLEQVASPMEIYQNPISLKLADFIGNPSINLVNGIATKIENGLVVESILGRFEFDSEYLTKDLPRESKFECFLGIRPELIEVSRTASPDSIEASLYSILPAGSETSMYLQIDDEPERHLLSKQSGIKNYQVDESVYVSIDPMKINVFAKDNERLIKRAYID